MISVEACAELTIEQLLREHQKNIAGLGSWRVTVVGEVMNNSTDQYQVLWEETWVHAGGSNRFTSKTYQYFDSKNKLVIEDTPLHYDVSHDDREVRTLSNWDPDESIDLPLKPGGTDASIFASKKGEIYPRDPSSSHASLAAALLLFRPDNIHDLKHLITTAKRVEISDSEFGPVIEIDLPSGSIKCTLSPSHGYMVSRCEWSAQEDGSFVSMTEIQDFLATETGAWFPSLAVMKNEGGQPIMRGRVIEPLFGSFITKQDATVRFPAGARVDNRVENLIHIWGTDGKPDETFADFNDFRKWEDATGRANAAGGFSVERMVPRSNGLIYLNIALILCIVVLIFIRSRLQARS